MKQHYDIAIVGGGPAGSTAARFAVGQGAAVVLLEKDREIGLPVRCAEGIGEDTLLKYVGIDPSWIASRITAFGFHSPSGIEIAFQSPNARGCILNRCLFDHALAELAAQAGAEIYTKAYVCSLRRSGRSFVLGFRHIGQEREITADIVIAADGIESRIAHLAGIKTKLPLRDIEACAQMHLANIEIHPERCDFYVSNRWAPGGYVWVFPKGVRTANVGLGINGVYAGEKPALSYLQDFVKQHFPQATVLTTTAGGVPVARTLDPLVSDGLMVIGDAAHQVNPLTGGGISAALAAGKMAGLVAAEAVKAGDNSSRRLMSYQKEWNKSYGKEIRRYYRLKEWVMKLTDQDYEDIAAALDKLPPEEITLTKIFQQAVKKKPSLIPTVVKIFAGL